MFKYLFLLILTAGIYIGFTYQDQIEDILDLRDMEEVQDSLEDFSDVLSDGTDSLTDKFNELTDK